MSSLPDVRLGSPQTGADDVPLGGELFKMAAGVDLAHVPYRATPAIVADLLENRLQMSVLGVADCRQYVASGQLRALAVSYTERMPEFPDVPTFAEVGYPNVRASNDFGIAIRADTPAPIKAPPNMAAGNKAPPLASALEQLPAAGSA